MNPHSPIKTRNQRKAAAQAQRRADPVRRSLERSVDNERRAVAREDLAVRASESAQRAVAREDPEVRARESAQRAMARSEKTHCDNFLQSQPSEEHQHFKLYYEFKSLISSILRNGMDSIDPSKFIGLYRECYSNFNANEGKWHGNFIKQ